MRKYEVVNEFDYEEPSQGEKKIITVELRANRCVDVMCCESGNMYVMQSENGSMVSDRNGNPVNEIFDNNTQNEIIEFVTNYLNGKEGNDND